jgi:hypothetical protein
MMKLLSTLLFFTAVLQVQGEEDEMGLEQIHAEREAVLTRIVEAREWRLEAGEGEPDDLTLAKLDLLIFQRNIALDWSEKKELQSRIVQLQKSRHAVLESNRKEGRGDVFDLLQAKDRYLAARQKLLELEASAPSREIEDDGSQAE